ncbi:MAG: hypothetical protein M3Z38_03845 [Bombilactobacillus mellifer]|nr:hypothetical protein [Bombilactobacillus mellifer]
MVEKKDINRKDKTRVNNSTIKMLSWLIVGLCTIFLIIGFNLHRNVYLPILVMVLVSTVSLFNIERSDLKKLDFYNIYFAAFIDIVAFILYFLQSMGKI